MKTAYFDCNAGISGNMLVGALIDLGLPTEILFIELQKLPISLPELKQKQVTRREITATFFEVDEIHGYHHRHLAEIINIIETAKLKEPVKQKAKKIFLSLAEAEAKIHGVSVEEVHFHEVGALDAIIDIVGAAIGMEYFQIDKVVVSPIRVGFGSITCAHGVIPVPAPAVVELLKGFEIFGGEIEGEWATPTGAAILKAFAAMSGPLPRMKIIGAGYGAGSRDQIIPNVLRVMFGDEVEFENNEEPQIVLETNIDDMNPEFFGYLGDLLLEAGAKDFYFTPVQMKKGRPGVLITILAPLEQVPMVEEILLIQTTTLGVRKYQVNRRCLERSFIQVEVAGREVKIKTAWKDGILLNYAPEYENCLNIAKELKIPLKDIYEEAKSQARKILKNGGAS